MATRDKIRSIRDRDQRYRFSEPQTCDGYHTAAADRSLLLAEVDRLRRLGGHLRRAVVRLAVRAGARAELAHQLIAEATASASREEAASATRA